MQKNSIQKTFLIAGLGNPGRKYEKTRHNIGFLVLNLFAVRHGFVFKEMSKLDCLLAKGVVDGVNVVLLMPTTFMNNSGIAVRKVIDYFKFKIEDLVLVTDDADLSFGQLRMRAQGSSGGHNGLKSVQQHLGMTSYLRLRIGIGRGLYDSLEQYVLSNFSKEEEKSIITILNNAVGAIEYLFQNNLEETIEFVNSSCMNSSKGEINGGEKS